MSQVRIDRLFIRSLEGRVPRGWWLVLGLFLSALWVLPAREAQAASPCDAATQPSQCGWFEATTLPPFVRDAIVSKGGALGAGNVLVLTSGDPGDPDTEISSDVGQVGCGTNPDGWETFDCVRLDSFVPPQDSVVLALSSEWFEWYQTIFTDWMTIAGAGVPTVDVSINSWINSKVDVLPYGPADTGVVILTSLAASKMVNFRVADSGDHIYDTAIVVVPATWLGSVGSTNIDATILCGDGILEPGEECDDGNTITDDGCSSLCLGTQQPPITPPPAQACGNLVYAWPNGTTSPYTCGNDLCAGYRCVVGDTISPACYTADQCAAACAGVCVDIQTAALDCSTMCSVQPPATQPPPILPATCASLVYSWPDGSSMPYTCDDVCVGQRCVIGSTISPTCYDPGTCDATSCAGGVCVDTPAVDCGELCALGELPATCTAQELHQTRPAANQKGPCQDNVEICNSQGVWELADGSWQPDVELCNGLDDDCNGVADDMFVTCGDPGLCQNTVNTCDPANPTVPVACVTLPAPSPVEICNDGLDNDCDGSADDGCECGDGECMPGETYENCPGDCPAPSDGSPCEDGSLCTAGDTYQNGVCVPGAAVSCDAGNACVVGGSCDPATGCTATKVNCDDGIACTADSCDSASGCLHTPNDSACADTDPCTVDSCDVTSGCVHSPDPACQGQDADGDGYTSIASGGTDCDDGNPAVHPGALEVCNGLDDDCAGGIDDAPVDAAQSCVTGLQGVCSEGETVCVAGALQCQQSVLASAEVCSDGLDNDCDGVVDPDADGDGACDAADGCPDDPGKTVPGVCGCGTPDHDGDGDGDGVLDCLDRGQDLAVTAITPPGAVTLTAKSPSKSRNVSVRIQNRGPTTETIPDAVTLASLVRLTVSSLGTVCPDAVATLSPPGGKAFPIDLRSKASHVFRFEVTFDCANDPAKTTKKDPGHDDFRYVATVDRSVLDGLPDTHAADDSCPRTVTPPSQIDPNPDGTIKDKGCGDPEGGGTFGVDETTDVIVNP